MTLCIALKQFKGEVTTQVVFPLSLTCRIRLAAFSPRTIFSFGTHTMPRFAGAVISIASGRVWAGLNIKDEAKLHTITHLRNRDSAGRHLKGRMYCAQ